jgi:replication-associated recombination protein RarA
MLSIDEIILRSINPFDNFFSVNFWHKQQQPEPTVDSIHQEVIAKIEAVLDQVAQDHHTLTVILDGDAGSGKTYLLGRLKKKFNHKAFFIYIPLFPQSD